MEIVSSYQRVGDGMNKKLKIITLSLVFLFALGCAGYKFVHVDGVTTLQGIELGGNSLTKDQEILSVIEVNLNTNWEEISTDEIQLAVMKLPLIEAVQVEVGFDRVLRVIVSEAHIIAGTRLDKWCELYSNGHLNCRGTMPYDVPIVDISLNDVNNWKMISRYLEQLKNNENEIYDDLAMLKENQGEFEHYFNSHRLKVRLLPHQKNAWVKYKYLLSNFPKQISEKQSLDLRFEGYAYAS